MSEQKARLILLQLKEQNRKHWIERRLALAELEDEGGYLALGYTSFKAFCGEEFGALYSVYATEYLAISIERLVGVPLATYAYTELAQLRQFRLRVARGGQGGRVVSDLSAAEQIRHVWAVATEIEGGGNPSAKSISEAIAQIALLNPKIKPPRPLGGAELWKKRYIAAEAEVTKLRAEVTFYKKNLTEATKLREELEVARQAIATLTNKVGNLKKANENLMLRKNLGVMR